MQGEAQLDGLPDKLGWCFSSDPGRPPCFLLLYVCIICFKSRQLKNATLEWKVISLTQMLISLKTIGKYARVCAGGSSLFSGAFR